MRINRTRVQQKGGLNDNTPSGPRGGIDRREFISNGCKLAGALLFASSLGALAGCGRDTSSEVDSSSTSREAAPENTDNSYSSGATTQSEPSNSTGAVNCRFYDNGTCSKTGRPCTNCIEGH